MAGRRTSWKAGVDDGGGCTKEFGEELAAGAAGRGRVVSRATTDGKCGEIAFALCQGRHHCHAFGAEAKAVGGVFNIETSGDGTVGGAQGGTNRKAGVGGVGVGGGGTRGIKK